VIASQQAKARGLSLGSGVSHTRRFRVCSRRRVQEAPMADPKIITSPLSGPYSEGGLTVDANLPT
jgi:hypothetical protein